MFLGESRTGGHKMAEELESRWIECVVIGKTTERRGLFFARTVYNIAIRIPDANPSTITFEASFDQYCSAEVGKQMQIKLYRTIKDDWVTSREYAEHLNNSTKTS
jgi:hypothetical protein